MVLCYVLQLNIVGVYRTNNCFFFVFPFSDNSPKAFYILTKRLNNEFKAFFRKWQFN